MCAGERPEPPFKIGDVIEWETRHGHKMRGRIHRIQGIHKHFIYHVVVIKKDGTESAKKYKIQSWMGPRLEKKR